MIERRHELALTRQAKLLKLSRSSVYYRPRPVWPTDLAIMRRIDELKDSSISIVVVVFEFGRAGSRPGRLKI